MNNLTAQYLETVKKRNPGEPEFHQCMEEILVSLEPVLAKYPEFVERGVIDRLIEPDRQIMFKVPWLDDSGKVQVNRGFRVQFNNALGPYKGGLRFHPSVYLGIIKFLGFEQIFKNALTTLPLGGGKGGSDFDPKGKSDAEIMRFCQSYMTELSKYIDADTDVPAGDIGVGAREIGYLFGQYKRMKNKWEGVLTGKGVGWGGSLARTEATGYGIVYFTENMMQANNSTLKGKTVAISGFGNVSWGAVSKATELGAKVVTISGPDGYIYDEAGINTPEKIAYMLELRATNNDVVAPYADEFPGAKFFPGKKPWEVKVDVCIPCATQNEINLDDAKNIVAGGTKFVCEGANMPCTLDAVKDMVDNGIIVGPSKAANAGGVAVSALEMSQNSMRLEWSFEEVDERLKAIMASIFKACDDSSKEFGMPGNYIAGANIAGFMKVAKAMLAQGAV